MKIKTVVTKVEWARALAGILGALTLVAGMTARAGEIDPQRWAGYLDFAYVYSSADAKALQQRIDQYGKEAGIELDEYMLGYLGSGSRDVSGLADEKVRRQAIGFLLQYVVSREPKLIERSADAISRIQTESSSFEDRYWYHYILAHRAMEKGDAGEFVHQNLELWMNVILPMEADFDTFDALSLSQSANSGFVGALPYLFENITRLVLIRSQEMSLDQDLDPLAAVVRMLQRDRVGAHPDVIPADASASGYLERIVRRLDGPESDSGSLTFTLALFEAGKSHDRARGLLANEGFSSKTLKALDVTSGAYQLALRRSMTIQGETAVYVRALRQMGEINAAKQRLDVDPRIGMPFDIEGAIETYEKLISFGRKKGWKAAGYQRVGREVYVEATHSLWEEIQEATLNTADYYLWRSVSTAGGNDEDVRSAAQMYARYIAFFKQHAGDRESSFVPDSAYFAAYEASKGFGDALLRFGTMRLSVPELELVTQRYLTAIKLYPLDRTLWASGADGLEKLGRSKDYIGLARPLAIRVTRSRHVNNWINNQEHAYKLVETLRNGLADDLVLMYLGFASKSKMDDLKQGLRKLQQQRSQVRAELASLTGQSVEALGGAGPAAPARSQVARPLELEKKIAHTQTLLSKLERKIEARAKALPRYEALRATDPLIDELRAQRKHPFHTLLRRLYYEKPA